MFRNTKVRLFLLSVFAVVQLLVVSCAGLPEQGNAGLTVSLMSQTELKKEYGTFADENPFIPPTGLFQRTNFQFFIIKFEGTEDYINIESVRVRFGDTYVRTTLYGPIEFKAFWDARDAEPDEKKQVANYNKKYRTIDRAVADPSKPIKITRNHSKVIVAVTESTSEEMPTVELRYNNGIDFFEKTF